MYRLLKWSGKTGQRAKIWASIAEGTIMLAAVRLFEVKHMKESYF